MKKSLSKFSLLIWIVVFVLVWEIIATYVAATKRSPENILPHLYQIFSSFFSNEKVAGSKTISEVVFSAATITLSRAVIGFSIGILFGFILALLMDLFHLVEHIAFPYLMIIQMIPILGMAPIIYAMTKDIDQSRIIIAAILTFYPVSTNVLAGFKAVEKEKLELLYLCNSNKVNIYVKTKIPSALPYFFIGLKIAAPMAITASILVDTLQGDGGLGCMLSQSLKGAMSRYVFWDIVFVSAVIGILSSSLMGLLERIFCRYKYPTRHKKKEVTNNEA